MTSRERVVGLEQAARFVQEVRGRGGTVAFTNGCFDLLHAGHVELLETARSLADALVVGVNGDDSVRRLKGPGRPLQAASDRARVVAALRAVDRVVVFEALTAEALLAELKPDVYVKGGDYTFDTLPEREAARRVGARVVLVPLLEGRSTTALVRRMGGGGA
ncbi:MAG TPA: D-glycero-beta-D-manno-heptose 1-phosphate adenylyltransferase [Limnochordales bacterium]